MPRPRAISKPTVAATQSKPISSCLRMLWVRIHSTPHHAIAKMISEPTGTPICRARKSPAQGSIRNLRAIPCKLSATMIKSHNDIARATQRISTLAFHLIFHVRLAIVSKRVFNRLQSLNGPTTYLERLEVDNRLRGRPWNGEGPSAEAFPRSRVRYQTEGTTTVSPSWPILLRNRGGVLSANAT